MSISLFQIYYFFNCTSFLISIQIDAYHTLPINTRVGKIDIIRHYVKYLYRM